MKCDNCEKKHINENTGCNNSGYYNSGYYNSGDYNSGNRNSGYYNSGDRNSGYYNSGDCNRGNRNSGYYNSGNRNSGMFNTDEPKMRMFNKETDMTYSEFSERNMVYPDLKVTAWVDNDDLREDEQTEETAQMGGKLKILTYKEAWKEYWGRASEDDKKWFKDLPNFDSKIFTSITGIDVETTETIKIGNREYNKSEVEEALKGIESLN